MQQAARFSGGSPVVVFALACALTFVGCSGAPTESGSEADLASGVRAPLTGTPLRVMAANTTSGNEQSYDLGHGTRMFQGLKPDLALIQEFKVGSGSEADVRAYVDKTFGASYAVHRERASLPNGIVSRYPIAEAGVWDDPKTGTRGFVWAKIAVPGSRPVWAVSLHLLTTSGTNRRDEATAIVASVRQFVPQADYLVIGGDFNTGSRTEPCVKTLSQIVRTGAPYPEDARGNGNTSARRNNPLDWVMADDDLAVRQVPTRVGEREYPNGLVFDSRVFTPLADVAPVQSGDSAAPSMQHMPVVKDFMLATDGTDAPDASR